MAARQKTLSGGVAAAEAIVNPPDLRKKVRLVRVEAILRTVDHYQRQETPVNREALIGTMVETFGVSRETVVDDVRSLESAQCLRAMGMIETITPRGKKYLVRLQEGIQ